jgi:hypothetical protein
VHNALLQPEGGSPRGATTRYALTQVLNPALSAPGVTDFFSFSLQKVLSAGTALHAFAQNEFSTGQVVLNWASVPIHLYSRSYEFPLDKDTFPKYPTQTWYRATQSALVNLQYSL